MYRVDVDTQQALVEIVLDGVIRQEEMARFMEEMNAIAASLAGREFKVLADMRTFRAASQQVAEMLRGVQQLGLTSGVKRVAELVESDIVALQLNRVARESGMERVLRRFNDGAAARRWLLTGEG